MSAHKLNSSQSFQSLLAEIPTDSFPHTRPTPTKKPTRTTLNTGKIKGDLSYHSKSLYMIVKKTCKNRLTALINTDSR